ncbi:MAG TPA: CRISPR-associated helicase Cas3' [Kiritimatiellia bacterium]|nr:CRISPR-associated helicase Cas3' [Kiritimatiellia bacterium]
MRPSPKVRYARTRSGTPLEQGQTLGEHATGVAETCRDFASLFGAGEWGYFLGMAHDLGKATDAFQERLKAALDDESSSEQLPGRVDHSTAGAQYAALRSKSMGLLYAYALAGHHAGLANGHDETQSCLSARLTKVVDLPDQEWVEKLDRLVMPGTLPYPTDATKRRDIALQVSFFIRMIFSCLVDADCLNSEQWSQPDQHRIRGEFPNLAELRAQFFQTLEARYPIRRKDPNPLVAQRSDILWHCLEKAKRIPGLYSLTVPTGGGKTLASMAFALKHSECHGHQRIIYAIPYTSIIEQTAKVFRSILGEDAVLEHHSSFEPDQEDQRSRLASENWGAPLVVTTNVQLFNSLYSNRTSACRKNHHLTRAIIILDEAQALPIPYIQPCLSVLRELVDHYGATIILCTATQPAFKKRQEFPSGLEGVEEIIPDPRGLSRSMRRTRLTRLPTLSIPELADRIRGERQVLCIVNTKAHARALFTQLGLMKGVYHLSAAMCPAHRRMMLSRLRRALHSDTPCLAVSTQVIEAGVDIDFPVVYRAAAGLDSLVQAAGRCNREGIRPYGHVYWFTPAEGVPAIFRQAAETLELVSKSHNDLLSLEAMDAYFQEYYWLRDQDLDKKGILRMLQSGVPSGLFPFRDIADAFSLIDDQSRAIIIPFNREAKRWINDLKYAESGLRLARKLQPFSVNVASTLWCELEAMKAIEWVKSQYPVLRDEFRYLYSNATGLSVDGPNEGYLQI